MGSVPPLWTGRVTRGNESLNSLSSADNWSPKKGGGPTSAVDSKNERNRVFSMVLHVGDGSSLFMGSAPSQRLGTGGGGAKA